MPDIAMHEAHSADYSSKSKFDLAAIAIAAVVDDKNCRIKLGPTALANAESLNSIFEDRAAQIVRAWD